MEQKQLLYSTAIALIFAIAKFIEIRFILKTDIIMKPIIRDSALVFVSTIVGLFVVEQVAMTVDPKYATSAFTGAPDF